MTDTARIHEILADACTHYRNGPEVTERDEGGLHVTEVFAMPPRPIDESLGGRALVDCQFITVGVDIDKAEEYRDELFGLLESERPMFERGASFIHIGGWLGDQEAALSLMAMGEVCGFWRLITPALLGLEGSAAAEAAGRGYIMVSGFRHLNEEPGEDRGGGIEAEPENSEGPDREEQLQEIALDPQYAATLNWLLDMNPGSPENFLRGDGKIALPLDAAALIAATLIHAFSRNTAQDLEIGNFFILRLAYHMGVLRELQNNIAAQNPNAPGSIHQKRTPHVDVICPHCGTPHDRQTSIGQDAEIGDGDISICVKCGEVSVFSSEVPGKLRKPHDGMEKTMIEENEHVRAAIQSWRETVGKDKERGPLLH